VAAKLKTARPTQKKQPLLAMPLPSNHLTGKHARPLNEQLNDDELAKN
jgi:hypothetical protein